MSDPNSHRAWVLAALDQFEGRLVRYAQRMLDDEHAARDVVQHTFLRLCHASEDDIGERLAPWLFTVCRNRVWDCLRQAGREASFADSDMEELGKNRSHLPVNAEDPAMRVERKEVYARIRSAVGELAGNQRETIWLYADGFTYREIASITGRAEGSIRVIVHRAIARLRQHPQLQYLLDDQPTSARQPPRVVSQRVSG